MGIFQKVPRKYLVGNNWANGFKTHNELTMYPLGKYPLSPSVIRLTDRRAFISGGVTVELVRAEFVAVLELLLDVADCHQPTALDKQRR
jgi:hypothetical protein